MKNITLLGSTGSIGVSTLDVVGRRQEQFRVFALVAGNNTGLLAEQIARFRPRMACVATEEGCLNLTRSLAAMGLARGEWPEILVGPAGRVACSVQPEADFVMSAIVGVAGLEATWEAIRHGKSVGLATKEVLVASGNLVMDAVRQGGTALIPVDSEHNGAHQCFRAGRREEVARLILTASGGPFRETPIERLESVTPAQALNHPTWRMGQRITIDSATMMNKGFEVIEACRLFNVAPEKVEVIVHPQSTIHSMVEFIDGSILAQFSVTDMRLPILYALTYPDRIESDMRFPVMDLRQLEFCPPDMKKFPCLRLAYEAVRAGGGKTVALNAADEVVVAAFLDGCIRFDEIPEIIEQVLDETRSTNLESIKQVLQADAEARRMAHEKVALRSDSAKRASPLRN